jgi:hypothetical protein
MAKTKDEILTAYKEHMKAGVDEAEKLGSWEAAKSRMIKHFEELPFNTRIKTKYKDRVSAAKWRKPDVDKAADNYEAKVF